LYLLKNLLSSNFKANGKAFAFADEEDELKAKIDELHSYWISPKDGAARDMSLGMWVPSTGLVRVLQQRSKILHHMGFTWRQALHIFIEEAVYLMDRGSMLMVDEAGAAVALREAFGLMAASGVTAERYQVYSYFMRLGYYIRRHPAVWQLEADCSPAQALSVPAWEYPGERGAAAAQPGAHSPAACASSPAPPSSEAAGAASARPLLDPPDCSSRQIAAGTEDGRGDEKPRRKKARTSWWPGLNGDHPWLGCVEYESLDLPRCLVEAEPSPGSPEGWTGPGFKLGSFSRIDPNLLQTRSEVQVVFDVFKANSSLKRRSPDAPMYHVLISSCPPTVKELFDTAKLSLPGSPVFALVEDGAITLYRMELTEADISLPPMREKRTVS